MYYKFADKQDPIKLQAIIALDDELLTVVALSNHLKTSRQLSITGNIGDVCTIIDTCLDSMYSLNFDEDTAHITVNIHNSRNTIRYDWYIKSGDLYITELGMEISMSSVWNFKTFPLESLIEDFRLKGGGEKFSITIEYNEAENSKNKL